MKVHLQSAHPLALFCLFLFRIAAITIYILSGFFISNYVVSVSVEKLLEFEINLDISMQTVVVVVLLAMDFWNCRVCFRITVDYICDSNTKLRMYPDAH